MSWIPTQKQMSRVSLILALLASLTLSPFLCQNDEGKHHLCTPCSVIVSSPIPIPELTPAPWTVTLLPKAFLACTDEACNHSCDCSSSVPLRHFESVLPLAGVSAPSLLTPLVLSLPWDAPVLAPFTVPERSPFDHTYLTTVILLT